MSRRTKQRRAIATPPQPQAQVSFGFGGSSGYTAADQSTARGMIWFPNLDSKRELNGYSRTEIIRKARWLCRNDGMARRFRRGIAEMVGCLRPNPNTSDQGWNEEALAAFAAIAESPLVFDRAGREDFYQRQVTLTERALEDGDCSVVLTQTGNYNPATALFEAPQMEGVEKEGDWIDGVLVNSDGRALKYRYTDPGRENAVIIDAANVIHFGLFETSRSIRGVSGFAHAVNKLIDVRELDNDQMLGIKAANQVGWYLKNADANAADLPINGAKVKITNPLAAMTGAQGAQTRDLTMEAIVGPGGKVVELDRGQDLSIIHDERRHPNAQALINEFVRNCSWGFDFPPEALWFLGSLTGPAVRYTIKSAERATKRYRKNLERNFCQRFWVYAVAKLMRQGMLRQCSDPQWWKCQWIQPESLTIDLGRDWAASIQGLQSGALSLAEFQAEAAMDWREQMRQRAEELEYAQKLVAEKRLDPSHIAALAAVQYQPPAAPQPQNPNA